MPYRQASYRYEHCAKHGRNYRVRKDGTRHGCPDCVIDASLSVEGRSARAAYLCWQRTKAHARKVEAQKLKEAAP